ASWTMPASSMSVIGTSSDQLEQQSKHQRDDRDALKEHREQQACRANLAGRLRLTGDSLSHLAANATQPDPAADHRQAQSDTGAEQAVDVLRSIDAESTRRILYQRKQVQHVVSTFRLGRSRITFRARRPARRVSRSTPSPRLTNGPEASELCLPFGRLTIQSSADARCPDPFLTPHSLLLTPYSSLLTPHSLRFFN